MNAPFLSSQPQVLRVLGGCTALLPHRARDVDVLAEVELIVLVYIASLLGNHHFEPSVQLGVQRSAREGLGEGAKGIDDACPEEGRILAVDGLQFSFIGEVRLGNSARQPLQAIIELGEFGGGVRCPAETRRQHLGLQGVVGGMAGNLLQPQVPIHLQFLHGTQQFAVLRLIVALQLPQQSRHFLPHPHLEAILRRIGLEHVLHQLAETLRVLPQGRHGFRRGPDGGRGVAAVLQRILRHAQLSRQGPRPGALLSIGPVGRQLLRTDRLSFRHLPFSPSSFPACLHSGLQYYAPGPI